MASSYAIPVSPNYHYHHQHSHSYTPSYSSIQLSPKRERTNSLNNGGRSNGYGNYVKKTSSNGSLYTHAEVSPERSSLPQALPNLSQDLSHNSQYNVSTFQANGHVIEPQNTPTHQHTTSFSSMKSRPRGESDLGRPKSAHHHAQSTASIPSSSAPLLSIPEALTSLLIPLPFLVASAAFPAIVSVQDAATSSSAFAKLQHSVLEEDGIATHPRARVGSAWIDTCIITSGSLILVGCLAKVRASTRSVGQRKEKVEQTSSLSTLLNPSTLRYTVTRTLSVGLPFYASALIGGSKTGMILLVSYAAGQAGPGRFLDAASQDWKNAIKSRSLTLAVIFVSLVLDVLGVTSAASLNNIFAGYLALACSMLALDSPLPKGTMTNNAAPSQNPSSTMQTSRNNFLSASPMMRTIHDTHITLVAGIISSILTVIASMIFSETWNMTPTSLALDLLAIALFTTAVFLSRPASLHSRRKAGLALGCFSASIWSILTPYNRTGMVGDFILAILFYFSVYIDTIPSSAHKPHDHHDHDTAHNTHDHKNTHSSASGKHHSAFTQMILDSCEPGSLVYDIVSEKDSRRIAYFTLLNFGFMLVQGGYGYLSGSLGLLSDTVHMFFDCLGLVVGLGAAVAAKWPTSPEKPYGWGKLNTLAGFGNGIFLMLVSVEFVWEAIEGILEHRELRHVQELLVVSTLGFLVNMVGLFAFGHAHAGHDHGGGHSHSHSHSHDHSHSHSHDHSTAHNHSHSHSHSHAHSHAHEDEHNHSHGHAHGDHCDHKHEPKAHSHSHDHDNENMHGIFLHVAADAGGSLAVILSTALTLWKPWYLWDPLATIIIAVLIFAAAVPLVTSSGRKLLLIVPNQLEYSIKNTLQELSEFRGVIGYTVPRFWIDDKDSAGDSHGHHHHGHDHSSGAGREKVMGVIHIIVAASASLEEVKHRVEDFVRERDMDLVIHVEREGEGHEMCWCGGGQRVV